MGIAAVHAASVENMAQLAAKIDNSAVKNGERIFVRCKYDKNSKNRFHRKASVSIDGLQVATAPNKTDDEVNFLIALRNMRTNNTDGNTVRVRIWQPSDGVSPK